MLPANLCLNRFFKIDFENLGPTSNEYREGESLSGVSRGGVSVEEGSTSKKPVAPFTWVALAQTSLGCRA